MPANGIHGFFRLRTMRWYWAILQTIAIFTPLYLLASIRPMPESIISFILAAFAIWVAADSSSFGWGIFVFLVWPIAYPWYLIVRPDAKTGRTDTSVEKDIPMGMFFEPTCGQCHSKIIEYENQETIRYGKGPMASIIAMKRSCTCKDCLNKWTEESSVDPNYNKKN